MFGALLGLGIIAVAVVSFLVYSRYGERHVRPDPHWNRTDEVFKDPTTGRTMRVWLDGKDGSRHYLSE
jgi:hypothetical protein